MLMMLLKFLFEPPLLGLARMTGPKCRNASQAALLLGPAIILLKTCVSNTALDALAARGMRLTRVTHGGCDSPEQQIHIHRIL